MELQVVNDNMEKVRHHCLCDLCSRIFPMQERISKALPEELKKDFDYLMMRLAVAEEDFCAANAKLVGEWPGWEWIKEARKVAEGLNNG